MPAATYAELYRFEDILLPQYEAVLEAASVTAATTRQTGNLSSPRVELSLRMGGTDDHAQVVTGGAVMFDRWKLTMQATVITGRNQNNATHATYLGKVRYLMLAPSTSATINAAILYHKVCAQLMAEDTTEISLQDDEDQDKTVLTFSGMVMIRADAWPTSAP